MFLYKVEIALNQGLVYLIVLAESDERAFGYAESHLTRHFIACPEVKEMAIVEKKRVEKGAGYVVEGK
jgi:hypothetical protein